jgi:hypothetical protein
MSLPTKFRFRKLDTIGAADAEEDSTFLKECFVDMGDLSALREFSDPRRIVVGRTGSGKTALLSRLKDVEKHVIEVRPENLALAYISNSNILNFFIEIGVRLDVFFKLLWRHVFAVEILKEHFHIITEDENSSFMMKVKSIFKDKKDEKALEYLETWGKSFWLETEYRIKEVTQKIEDDLQASAKSQFPGISFTAGAASKLTEEQKSEIVQRAQHVVNNVQIRQLSDIIDLIDRVLTDPQKKYFIVIDKLDENWIEDRLRFRLVRALIESVRDFRKVGCVKIVVCIRYDLLRRVFRVTRDAGFQEEKYDSLYLKLHWTRGHLANLLDQRINYLVKQRYTNNEVTHKDILPKSIQKQDAFDYILDRTFMRPRDIIAFFNQCIQQSIDSPIILPKTIQNAEHEYSHARFRSLGDEWFADYPNLLDFAIILKAKSSRFAISDVPNDECERFCLNIATNKNGHVDSLSESAYSVATGELKTDEFKKNLFHIFYRVGLVGLKLEAFEEYIWSFNLARSVAISEITTETKVSIHPMFRRVLGIKAL